MHENESSMRNVKEWYAYSMHPIEGLTCMADTGTGGGHLLYITHYLGRAVLFHSVVATGVESGVHKGST